MNWPEDPMAELFEICDVALQEARARPLTELEVNALRFASAISDGRAPAHHRGAQKEFSWD
jgi:hypothetical protein